MGRFRIKKKDAVIPFRQTLAYRLLLATVSVVLLMVTVYFIMRYVQQGYNVGIIASILAAIMAITAVFYNLSEVRNARVPARTLKRAKQRR